MTGRVCTASTFGASNPPETTITQKTTVTYSSIENNIERVNYTFDSTQVAEGWPDWGVVRTLMLPGMDADSSPKKRKRKSTQGLEEEIITQKKLKWRPPCDLLVRTTQEELEGSKHNDNRLGIQQLHGQLSLDEYHYVTCGYLSTFPSLEAVQAFKIRQHSKLLVEATEQLKKMLSGTVDSNIIAPEILAHLGRTEKVLLSCTTVVVGQDFATLADCKKSRDWAEEEKDNFCHKFTSFVRGLWTMEDVLGRWEEFFKDLTDKIDVWQPETCCTKVWDAGCDFGDYSQILKDLEHKNKHRLCEARKLEIKDRSRGIVQWDLMDLKVSVLYY